MKNLEQIKKIIKENKDFLREQYGVKEIGIFGSYARDEQQKVSDIDIVVEFERPIGLKFFELADFLEKLLDVKVDLFTPDALKQKLMLWKSVEEDLIYV